MKAGALVKAKSVFDIPYPCPTWAKPTAAGIHQIGTRIGLQIRFHLIRGIHRIKACVTSLDNRRPFNYTRTGLLGKSDMDSTAYHPIMVVFRAQVRAVGVTTDPDHHPIQDEQ